MKKNMLLFVAVIIGFSAVGQIANSSFEDWHLGSSLNYEEPDDWHTANEPISSFFTDFPVLKTTDAADDSFAVLLHSKYYPLIAQSLPGILTTAAISINLVTYEPEFNGGMPFTARPEKIEFEHKFIPAGPDTAAVYLSLLYIDTALSILDTIGIGSLRIWDTIHSYEKAEMIIKYNNADTPNTLMLTFTSGTYGSVTANTKYYVDDIEVDWYTGLTPLGIKSPEVKLYPNPAKDRVHIKLSDFRPGMHLVLYDLLGNKVMNYRLPSGTESLDVNSLRNGIYFFELQDYAGNKLKAGKFNIAK